MKKEVWEAKGQVPEHYRKQLLKVQKRVEEATKVSKWTVRRILGEQKKHEAQGTSFSLHGKTHKVPKHVTDIDDFVKCVIQLTIHEFYVQEKMSPTISKLFPKLRDRDNFNGGSISLRNIVKEPGFLWKTRNNRVVLIEKHDMRCMRVSHLTALNKYREGRPIVYKDETYVHSSHTGPKNLSVDCASGLLAPALKGERHHSPCGRLPWFYSQCTSYLQIQPENRGLPQ
jgi:hypothetical protein